MKGVPTKVIPARIIERYTAGESMKSLSQSTGVDKQFLKKLLHERGVELRGRRKPDRCIELMPGVTARVSPDIEEATIQALADAAWAIMDSHGRTNGH